MDLDADLMSSHLSLCLHISLIATFQFTEIVLSLSLTIWLHHVYWVFFFFFLQNMSTGLDTSVQTTIIHLPLLLSSTLLPHPSISRSMCLSCYLWCVYSLIWLDSSCAAREPSWFPVWPAANWWGCLCLFGFSFFRFFILFLVHSVCFSLFPLWKVNRKWHLESIMLTNLMYSMLNQFTGEGYGKYAQ